MKQIIFLDIETVPFTNKYEDLSDRMRANWSRKAGFLRTDVYDNDEKLYNTRAGIFAEFGRIVCISVGIYTGEQVRMKSY